VIRLTNFSLQKREQTEEDVSNESILKFITDQYQKINDIEKTLYSLSEKNSLKTESVLNTISDKLSLSVYTEIAYNLRRYSKDQAKQSRIKSFRYKLRKTKNSLNQQIERLWYRQSEGIIYAKKQISKDYKEKSNINEISDFVESCSINSAVFNALPFYYKQLFQSKQQFHNEFWVNRNKELKLAQFAVSKYMKGVKSCVLITGDPLAGKSFFSQYIATNLFKQANIYTLSPPAEGSSDKNILISSIESLFGSKGQLELIFQQINRKTIIIVDDLELWWEKTAQGLSTIDSLIDLIVKYSHKCFFIINVNSYTFNLMDKAKNIGQYFTSIIELNPFTAKQLKDAILIRHNSSGFRFNLNNKNQEAFFPWDYARLFNHYFNFSNGNVGFALQTWINQINSFEKNEVTSESPRLPEFSILRNLDKDWLFYLSLFVLHRRISLEKLKRISHKNEQELSNKIYLFLQSGLIIEKRPGIYEVNPNIINFLVNILKEKELI